ncbi:outer membrane beta-barrel protein [Alloacidobacterium dinghuense]|uniref:Outer membrane beta-barrel protein n=1 Tax=Alloacidobacterium dinghuense TaxID=2763107 RepID=A0A7G8BJ96_9BACT|nr:outer membrane beta-barrel protein [Alloacidobacterium dinghuense]QNI32616.1 outer membrane beta-barrel protein [Alloacidobacterium dinghuense]
MPKSFLLVVLGLGLPIPLHGQVVGSAEEPAGLWYAGAEYSRLNPDYWAYPTVYMNGLSVYGGYRLDIRPHTGFGVEGTWRTLLDRDQGTREQDSFSASGRYIFRASRFAPFGKVGGGFGHFRSGNREQPNPNSGQNGVHFVGAFGAGIDVRVTRYVYVRPLEWEQQVWSFSPNLLAPHSFSFGAAYRFR